MASQQPSPSPNRAGFSYDSRTDMIYVPHDGRWRPRPTDVSQDVLVQRLAAYATQRATIQQTSAAGAHQQPAHTRGSAGRQPNASASSVSDVNASYSYFHNGEAWYYHDGTRWQHYQPAEATAASMNPSRSSVQPTRQRAEQSVGGQTRPGNNTSTAIPGASRSRKGQYGDLGGDDQITAPVQRRPERYAKSGSVPSSSTSAGPVVSAPAASRPSASWPASSAAAPTPRPRASAQAAPRTVASTSTAPRPYISHRWKGDHTLSHEEDDYSSPPSEDDEEEEEEEEEEERVEEEDDEEEEEEGTFAPTTLTSTGYQERPNHLRNSASQSTTRGTRAEAVLAERHQMDSDPPIAQNSAHGRIESSATISRTLTEQQRATFKPRNHPSKFFRVGKVFKMLENVTHWTPSDSSNEDTTPSVRTLSAGYYVQAKIRRCIVVREGHKSCSAIAITTYEGRGLAKPDIKLEDHAVVYSGREPPSIPPAKRSANHFTTPRVPIKIDLDEPGEGLDPMSCVNYAKVFTIEHNAEVQPFGMVNRRSLSELVEDFREVFVSSLYNPG